MATEEPLVSPRLAALRRDLEAGNSTALTTFWQEIRNQGAPLVEPIEGDDQHLLVTFLWQGDSATEHVFLKSHFTYGNIRDNPLARLFDTDLWFRTYRLRKDLRTTYAFSANKSSRNLG